MTHDSEIAIVGRACRLPGAPSIDGLWELLVQGRCAVTQIPSDRWSLERFGHPRQGERGRSYTWASGVLDNVYDFDAAAFGVSPREAEQMDPQQRLLLELTWEALEDAGLPPSSLAGSETGVFVGASTNDYGNARFFDIAAADGYFATGNAASILSNRISYIFDLNGPSFTVDTACSSSLVALEAAVQALRSGRIDTAIVGGVSILLAPFQFISFSQASMLSRRGLCQAFSAGADGYVRSEGGGVLVLRTAEAAARAGDRVHTRLLATRVNSDGRTNGIALPSKLRQAQLLDQLYRSHGIDPDRLAFVEAHGTGTPVGDPIEAAALGETLGQRRVAPLPVGSIKSNIGHTEAAAGVAGLLKASLALEHDLLPPSLHCATLNPHIDFARLNLTVAQQARPLPRGPEPRLAGVSSYGFGGTNAHVILADAHPAPARPATLAPASMLMLSARSRAALGALAAAYADRLEAGPESAGTLAAAAHHRRDRLEERLVVALDEPGTADKLRAFAQSPAEGAEGIATGTALAGRPKVAFVFSGNGAQWVGMGRTAFAANAVFRARFEAVDALFQPLSGWSLAAAMASDTLAVELAKTSVAQPLIFAIQAASTAALAALGLTPDLVVGHSVGEVAAAEAAGVFDLKTAVRIIYYRSLHQETVYRAGGMTVLIGSREAADIIAETVPEVTIAAFNSPRAFTFSGTLAGIEAVAAAARGLKARVHKLDIAYPFHSPIIEPIRGPLLKSLGRLPRKAGTAQFVSSVTGSVLPGTDLDAGYWWRNIREPVLFAEAMRATAAAGGRIVVEIGPSPILLSHVGDTLAEHDDPVVTIPVLDRKDPPGDPFARAVAIALTRGARVTATLGQDPGPAIALPAYPWQRRSARLAESGEQLGFLTPSRHHPLIGSRLVGDATEWHGVIDTALLPELADHVVDGHLLLPGAAFAEMALAVARDWLGTATATVADFEIRQPLILDGSGSREVRCTVQPTTGTIEIMSRPRATHGAWQTHAVAKLLHATIEAGATPALGIPPEAPAVTGQEIYRLAAASGLAYGPAYRLLDTAWRVEPATLRVDLKGSAQDARMGLDPARIDACFHGLALLYRELSVDGRLKPYVPVAAAELRLHRPGVPVTQAGIAVLRSDARTILVDLTFLAADGGIVAVFRRVRFQAMSAFRAGDRAIDPIVATSVLAAEPLALPEAPPLAAADVLAAAQALDGLDDGEPPSPAFVLLDGWATATAFGLFEGLSDDGLIDPTSLVADGLLPDHLGAWGRQLLLSLARSGLASHRDDGTLALATGVELPDPHDILRALAAEHPERSAELLLAARSGAIVDALLAGDRDRMPPVTTMALDGFELGGDVATRTAALLGAILEGSVAAWPADRQMRILQLGDGPLAGAVERIAAAHGAALTLLDPDSRRLERARLNFARNPAVTVEGKLDRLPPHGFDLVIAAQTGQRILGVRDGAAAVAAAMAPGAVLALLEASTTAFRELVFGLHAAMLDPDRTQRESARLESEAAWTGLLQGMGLTDISVQRARGTDFGLLCVGQKPALRPARSAKGDTLIIGRGGSMEQTAEALATMLRFSGFKAAGLTGAAVSFDGLEVPEAVVYLAQPDRVDTAAGRLMARCLDLKALVSAIGTRKTVLWVVCPGATRAGDGDGAVEAGVWAFCRTIANETPTLDVRLIDLAPGLGAEVAARRLRDVILSGTEESDIVVDASGTRVLRFGRLAPAPAADPAAAAMRLVKGDAATGLDRLQWQPDARPAPAAGEVEIEVEAAGLNFRDVMWGLSILPEEILEDGFAGATLGLECAGRVVRCGPGVTAFAPGDRVLAFAKAALATHVTVPASVVAARPDTLGAVAAATIPVAFLTAYYALIRCARLAEDEWVLIHGGAGGVGLAAIQIARWRGARIIATAGSPERRDLLAVLGADHVFDSRSNQFVDDVRRVAGPGVDVVLNSLSGEAMERSLATLRPFGRFVELGKRDYVANTHIGLKPFRRNLSYFGVDLDQLMLKDDSTGHGLFREVMALFEDGHLTALPYRAFPANEVVEAFRVMQRSGHIGKIVILPPAAPAARATAVDSEAGVPAARPLRISPIGTHLVTGGLGGFGLETARWLVEAGARHLVLVGRSGAVGEAAQAAVAALRDAGASVEALALDITDPHATEAVFARFGDTLPPLAGVVHAATVFEDSLIANMTPEKLAAVVGAKAAGAALLDRLTRPLPLDYFLLYSSATTLIGNPGQGAYVAANGFLEGLARARRQAGHPALAVAWGAIADAGILTRSSAAATNLLGRAGVAGLPARRSLDALLQVSASLPATPESAVVAIAAIDWSTARDHLRVLRSKSFERLLHGAAASQTGSKGRINVGAVVEDQGRVVAAATIVGVVREEIARILRLPRDDINVAKPLMEIGLDSLMAVELGMALEEQFELGAPLSTAVGALSITGLADHIVGSFGDGGSATAPSQTSLDLAMRHLDADIRRDVMDALPDLVAGDGDPRKESLHS